MGICIYIYSKEPLAEARTDLEDDLEELIGNAGECTGGGQGISGWNIDLEIYDEGNTTQWTERLIKFLQDRSVPKDTFLGVLQTSGMRGWDVLKFRYFPASETDANTKLYKYNLTMVT